MFAATLDRSLHVWSDGFCPVCRESVPMYNWKIDPFKASWKVICPHCAELFPKNDFSQYYLSGLDNQGVFRRELADKSLLFNSEHPDPADSLHRFGVDDGNGFSDGDHCWRFINTYLYYGQWQGLVHSGIRNLAAAYMVTNDRIYARKAAIILDRVADLLPDFHFIEQGWAYEKHHGNGYVTTWHDSCEEIRELALAYDQIFEAIREDNELVEFLSAKAVKHGLPNRKSCFNDIQHNIEENMLRDALRNSVQHHWQAKIHSNYPRREITVVILKTVLDWPSNQKQIMSLIDEIISGSTKIDGVTGEKGLAGYASFVIQGLSKFLGQFDLIDRQFLPKLFERHSVLRQTWRFFLDTWCCEQYYPAIGDTSWFAAHEPYYQGVRFDRIDSNKRRHPAVALEPSSYTFLMRLYEVTNDPAYVQMLYQGNGKQLENLPFDLFCENPDQFRNRVESVINCHGSSAEFGDIDKKHWHLAIMRSGRGKNSRAVWLDYDAGGAHAHLDGMNLGLFAYGLDLMPDFGYPPVQFGGWSSPQVKWYTMTAAHNTVVVNGLDQAGQHFGSLIAGKTTRFIHNDIFHLTHAVGPELYPAQPENNFPGCSRYERTVVLVNLPDPEKFYLIDIFRVAGGRDHAKFFHSHFGTVTTPGLKLKNAADYGYNTMMRNFREDDNPPEVWDATWKIEDCYRYLPTGTARRYLRYTDLTIGTQRAAVCEGWIVKGHYGSREEAWIPRLMIRRQAESGNNLQSTFVSIIEPFCEQSSIAVSKRLPLQSTGNPFCSDDVVALEIRHLDGTRDLFVDTGNDQDTGQVTVKNIRDVQIKNGISFQRIGLNNSIRSLEQIS